MNARSLLPIALSLGVLAACTNDAPPFTPDATDRRLFASASALAVLSDAHESDALASAVTLGGGRDPEILLVSFERAWSGTDNVRAAFLRLAPRTGAPPRVQAVTIQAARARTAWRAADVTWSSRPAFGPPYAQASAEPNGELYIDVTALVRAADKRPEEDYGIALSGERGARVGATFATGAAGDSAPRLEVFVR